MSNKDGKSNPPAPVPDPPADPPAPDPTPAPSTGDPAPESRIPKTGQNETPDALAAELIDRAPPSNVEAMRRIRERNDDESFVRRKPGRPPNSTIGKAELEADKKRRSEEEAKKKEEDKKQFLLKCRKAGMQTCDTVVMVCTGAMGMEWNYLPPREVNGAVYDERTQMREAYADTFEYYEWDKFPPWLAMLMATSAYAVTRVQMPQTQAKINGWREKIAAWKAARKVRKENEAKTREATNAPTNGRGDNHALSTPAVIPPRPVDDKAKVN